VFFQCRVFVVVKPETYRITNMMHFSWAKTTFPGQSECFVAVLLTYLIRIDGASYLNGYCSLMFLSTFFNVFFINIKKTCFYVFYLQTNVFNVYGTHHLQIDRLHSNRISNQIGC